MALRVKGLLPKIVTLAGVTALAVAMPQPALAQPALGDSGASGQAAQDIATIADEYVAAGLESDTGLWIVQLDQPSLATYAGDIAGLPATSPAVTGTPKLDVNAPASHAYLNHLDQVQAEAIEAMENALGRSIEVAYQYQNVLNGLAVRVSAAEAAQLATLPGVAAVLPDIVNQIETDVSNDLIGSPSIWNGDTGPDLGTRGEGVIVGMLDTGVNAFHPSFAAVDGDGYAHTNPYGAGNYVGVCDPSHPNHQPVCNDKLIGAWNFNTNGPNFPSALDWNGHGSHVGSTIAGNKHEATFTFGQTEFTRTISGVAPRANVISYLVCDPGCPQSASVAAINQAIADGVDVLNYSISGTDNPWQDSVDLAFLDAFEAGIVVSASAGNSGPNTVAKTGPWNLSVAASTTKRIFAHTVDVDAHGITDLPAVPGDGPQVSADIEGELRVVAGNRDGCSPFPAGAFDGAIALIQRGGCEFGIKVNNADAAGAIAVVLFNNQGGPPTAPGGLGPNDHNTQIPTVMLEQRTGEPLWDLIIDQGPVDARINLEAQMFIDAEAWEDVMGAFSSTGPSRFEMLAPTVTAPGVNILAAVEADGADTDRYGLLQGTSMSSPHAAGSAALLVALHPDWTPAQIRSALASTADPEGIRAPDGVSEANPFHYGSGRVNLDAAGRIGLVMDETHANFVAANPATGGDPKTLNLPAFVNHECYECTWERTVTSVADTTVTYEVEWTKPADMGLEVTPSTFTIAPGESVDITVTVNGSALPNGQWAFADLRLVTNGTHANGQPVADVHYPIAIIASDRPADAPSISVEPDELSSVQGPDQVVTKELTIGNTGTAPLNWSVLEDATRLPQGATSPVTASAGSVAVEGATLTTAPRLLSGVFGPPAPRVVMPESPATPANTITITHSQSQAIVELNSVACSPDNGATTTENSYLRTFTLADFGITSDFAVSEVSFGVETLRSSPQTITVNVYRMTDPSSVPHLQQPHAAGQH